MSKPMQFVSTRGDGSTKLGFDDVLLSGLAPDGGLYLPETWPQVAASARQGSYVETAFDVMWPFVAGTITETEFQSLIEKAYADFVCDDVVELVELGNNTWLLELFHGPTLAFKDVALQLVGHLFDHYLAKRSERLTIVGATSGDTGSAAIHACRDRENLDIFILHPHGRVSEVQRRQMTTVTSSNVYNIAVEGTFDDCQDLVKAMFNHQEFRTQVNLGAVNSINWARVMAQIVYYVVASQRLAAKTGSGAGAGGGPAPAFVVPTGNFGNVFAGWAAHSMGLAVDHFCVASNRNDILTRLFNTGTMDIDQVIATASPSMDIQVSSNLERLLFEVHGRNGALIAEAMTSFRSDNTWTIATERLQELNKFWSAVRVEDRGADSAFEQIATTYKEHDMLIDPHTAVALAAAKQDPKRNPDTPTIALATAHPAKFGDAVEEASSIRPELPARLGELFDREERYEVLPAQQQIIEDYITARI